MSVLINIQHVPGAGWQAVCKVGQSKLMHGQSWPVSASCYTASQADVVADSMARMVRGLDSAARVQAMRGEAHEH